MEYSKSWLRRTERAGILSEARRVELVSATRRENNLGEDAREPAQIVQVVGRVGKKGAGICGAYCRVEERDGARVLYQGVDTTSGELLQDYFLILGGAREDGKGEWNRWRFVQSPDDKQKGWAYNKDVEANCPTRVAEHWHRYDGKSAGGYNADGDVKVLEIPIGFEPCASPANKYEVSEVAGSAGLFCYSYGRRCCFRRNQTSPD
jgi:ribosomal protein S28E/S33